MDLSVKLIFESIQIGFGKTLLTDHDQVNY